MKLLFLEPIGHFRLVHSQALKSHKGLCTRKGFFKLFVFWFWDNDQRFLWREWSLCPKFVRNIWPCWGLFRFPFSPVQFVPFWVRSQRAYTHQHYRVYFDQEFWVYRWSDYQWHQLWSDTISLRCFPTDTKFLRRFFFVFDRSGYQLFTLVVAICSTDSRDWAIRCIICCFGLQDSWSRIYVLVARVRHLGRGFFSVWVLIGWWNRMKKYNLSAILRTWIVSTHAKMTIAPLFTKFEFMRLAWGSLFMSMYWAMLDFLLLVAN